MHAFFSGAHTGCTHFSAGTHRVYALLSGAHTGYTYFSVVDAQGVHIFQLCTHRVYRFLSRHTQGVLIAQWCTHSAHISQWAHAHSTQSFGEISDLPCHRWKTVCICGHINVHAWLYAHVFSCLCAHVQVMFGRENSRKKLSDVLPSPCLSAVTPIPTRG